MCPRQNGIAERFMRTFKYEHVDYMEYDDFDDAQRQLQDWLEITYMTKRLHQALDYRTPAEFELRIAAPSCYLPYRPPNSFQNFRRTTRKSVRASANDHE